MHIQRHTHTSTHVQSAHKRNADNQAQEPGWGGRKKGFVRDLAHTPKKMSETIDIRESKRKGFEHIELPAKLLDYFLRSNKSNINQSTYLHIYIQTYKSPKTNPQNPTNPTNPTIQTYKHFIPATLHLQPYLRYKHTIARWGRVSPLIKYYAIRFLLANLLDVNFALEPPEEGRGVEFPQQIEC